MTYEPRTYRRVVSPEGLARFEVVFKETDLLICADKDMTSMAEDLVVQARWQIESFIEGHPTFAETFAPYDVPETATPLVQKMAHAARLASVGPMAAVAGAIAEYVARGLAEYSSEVIVENGGDIYLVGKEDRVVALHAGESSLSGKVGMLVKGGVLPMAVCTSSGTVGHSHSFGRADAAVALARDGALADAVATALANRVREPDDLEAALEAAKRVHGVLGLVVAVGDHLGAWGNVHLMPLDGQA